MGTVRECNIYEREVTEQYKEKKKNWLWYEQKEQHIIQWKKIKNTNNLGQSSHNCVELIIEWRLEQLIKGFDKDNVAEQGNTSQASWKEF